MGVRKEVVRLELEDHFSSQMARPAAAAKLFAKNLDDLDGQSSKAGDSMRQTGKDADAAGQSMRKASKDVEATNAGFRRGGADINQYSGRLVLFGKIAATLGPALVPIGAVAVPAVAALATGFTVAAAAAGTALLAFQGVGDGLKALDAYQLEPTRANLEKMQVAFDAMGPAAGRFARYLDSIEPEMARLRQSAAAGLFPGMEQGIENLLVTLPQFRRLVFNLGTAMGDLTERAGGALGGAEFADFFTYLENEGGPILTGFGDSLGNIAQGFANLMVAFGPLTQDFTGGLESMTQSFADWAARVGESQGFRDFVAYIRESTPQVLELLGSLAMTFVSIAQAAAPVGAVVLPMLTGMVEVLGAIAASDIGAPLMTATAAIIALNSAANLATASMVRLRAASAAASTSFVGLGTTAALLGGALAASLVDSFDDVSSSAEQMDANLRALASGQVSEQLDHLSWAADDLGEALQQAAFNDLHILDAADEIESLDAAMAELASRDLGAAKDAFATIEAEARRAGLSTEDLAALFPQYADAAHRAEAASRQQAGATALMGMEANRTRNRIYGLVRAMEEQRQEALSAFDAETRWASALADARKQAAKSAAGIRANTAAGRENRDALSALAGAWNNQSAAVRNNVSRFRQAREAFIDTAVAMGVPREAARRLAAQLMEIPKSKVIDVEVRAESAMATLYALKTMQIGDKSFTVHSYRVDHGSGANFVSGGTQRRADGGTIYGQRSPYRDKVLAYLAPGEEVISNRYGQADRHRELLKAINGNRYALGGTVGLSDYNARVGASAGSGAGSQVVVQPASLAGLRIEGDVKINGLDGQIRGTIREEIGAQRSHDNRMGGMRS